MRMNIGADIMSRLDPEKLTVEFREGVTATEPVMPRCYTLTHSDITAELFLTIGLEYAYDRINKMRDEVLGEWDSQRCNYRYLVYLYVDGDLGNAVTEIRNNIFRQELPLALEAIRYGDDKFFVKHKELDRVPILVIFISSDPSYRRIENWGTFSDYQIEE